MKRDIHLQPLSRQHHNGLLAALLIGKGLKKEVDLQVIAAFIIHLWNTELKAHFIQEEQVLIPALASTSLDPSLTQRLLHEHSQLRLFIDTLKTGACTKEYIASFATLLEQHIRFEERIYFPEAEKVLSPKALDQIGQHLTDEDDNCMNYPIKFWE